MGAVSAEGFPMPMRQSATSARWVLSAPLLVFLAVFAVFPLALGTWISLTDRSILSFSINFVGLKNYADTLRDPDFWHAVFFTLKFTLISTFATLVLGFLLALLVHRRFPGKTLLVTALIMPIMVAPALMGIMFRLVLNAEIGLVPAILDRFGIAIHLFSPHLVVPLLILLEILQWTPFTFLILYAGLQALPDDVFEAAALDGSSPLRTTFMITIPLMVPSFFVAGFLRAVDALRTFDVIFVLTGGGPGSLTNTLSIYIYKKAFTEGNFGLATAAAMLVLLMVVPLIPFLIRRVTTRVGDVP
ncbi:carbohydrate ABC transporter permease [Pararhizobium mangrovi]|nr:sugar ABC transporter permease [Pararhizobium mangrovi]